jgi:hypothetical protein
MYTTDVVNNADSRDTRKPPTMEYPRGWRICELVLDGGRGDP